MALEMSRSAQALEPGEADRQAGGKAAGAVSKRGKTERDVKAKTRPRTLGELHTNKDGYADS